MEPLVAGYGDPGDGFRGGSCCSYVTSTAQHVFDDMEYKKILRIQPLFYQVTRLAVDRCAAPTTNLVCLTLLHLRVLDFAC